MIRATHDPSLDVRVVSARPLIYREGADAALDRPAHVRAGSGLVVFGDAAWVVQDDALFLARIDLSEVVAAGETTASLAVASIALPAGHEGARQFLVARGTKKHKPDFECVIAVTGGIVAIGSGSTPARRKLVHVALPSGAAHVVDAAAFYAALEGHDFAGSELNVEGAIVMGDVLRLFQRGNGAPRDGRAPVNATADVALGDALAGHATELRHVRLYDLGALDGVPLSFTDATAGPDGGPWYLAAAEDSPDTYQDGVNVGCVLGHIDEATGDARYGLVREKDGAPSRRKLEGLAWTAAAGWLAVEDRDDPEIAAELVRLAR